MIIDVMKNDVRGRDFEARKGRKPAVVVLDTLWGVVYTRPVRGKRLVEDGTLQALYENKGLPALRRFAALNYHGFTKAVVV